MAIYISADLYSSGGLEDGDINANNPRIGYKNNITAGGFAADSELATKPASNLDNVSTAEYWESGSTATQYITITTNGAMANYAGIGAHNLSGAVHQFQYRLDPADPWTDATAAQIQADNSAIMHLFSNIIAPYWRLKIIPSAGIEPKIGIVFIGQTAILQRRIYVGHTPINYGRASSVNSGMSENGNFLGRVVTSQSLSCQVSQNNVTPEYYRSVVEPFSSYAITKPFFFAWRPEKYPSEVGFCWVTKNIVPSNASPNGMMSFEISLKAHSPWT